VVPQFDEPPGIKMEKRGSMDVAEMQLE